MPIANHIAILIENLLTRRSKKRPRDTFAMAVPRTANVCPISSQRIAFTRSVSSISVIFWPNPKYADTVVKSV